MKVVISQSMLFPWVGLLEQIRLADVFVHYDDVQFSKGSFVNRVQIRLPDGMRWMTVPLNNHHLGMRINEVQVSPSAQWRDQHLNMLICSFKDAPFAKDALQIAEEVYASSYPNLGALARASLLALARYFDIDANTRFVDITSLNIPGTSSERVLETVKCLQGSVYISGHGGARYLDHEAFERAGIQIEYMNYRLIPYPQSQEPFTPYVSGLDLVAHCGQAGIKYICSETLPWRNFTHGAD